MGQMSSMDLLVPPVQADPATNEPFYVDGDEESGMFTLFAWCESGAQYVALRQWDDPEPALTALQMLSDGEPVKPVTARGMDAAPEHI